MENLWFNIILYPLDMYLLIENKRAKKKQAQLRTLNNQCDSCIEKCVFWIEY